MFCGRVPHADVDEVLHRYASPTYGGQWDCNHSTLKYYPLVVLPLKKTILDGSLLISWLTPVPVEWLIERDWWVQTHWEDIDSRNHFSWTCSMFCQTLIMFLTSNQKPHMADTILLQD